MGNNPKRNKTSQNGATSQGQAGLRGASGHGPTGDNKATSRISARDTRDNRTSSRRRAVWILLPLALLVIVAIGFTWRMSGFSGKASNDFSYNLVDLSARWLMSEEVRWEAGFWHDAYNMMLRKLGHISEYLMIGFLSCLLFLSVASLLFRNRRKSGWFLAIFLSEGLSLLAAWFDEFFWQARSHRNPRWFDVGVDMVGATMGILLCLLVFSIAFNIAHRLQDRDEQISSS